MKVSSRAFATGSSLRKLHNVPTECLPGIALNPFTFEKGGTPGWISLLFVVARSNDA